MIFFQNNTLQSIPFPSDSVHCILFSIPYYQARIYKDEQDEYGREDVFDCGGWERDGIPCEECFICHTRQALTQLKRVLHPTGILWLNIGDTYSSKPNGYAKPKDLFLAPQIITIMMQREGWWIRSAPSWAKLTSKPESVKDRLTNNHEHILMATKERKYYFDRWGAAQPLSDVSIGRLMRGRSEAHKQANGVPGQSQEGLNIPRKARSLEDIRAQGLLVPRMYRTTDLFFDATLDFLQLQIEHIREKGGMVQSEDGTPLLFVTGVSTYTGEHFATWPTELCRLILAVSTSRYGVCAQCGNQYARNVEKEGNRYEINLYGVEIPQNGWVATCDCHNEEIVPATVFDPFCGSGTTMIATNQLRLRGLGCDINPAFLQLARERQDYDRLNSFMAQPDPKQALLGGDADVTSLPLFSLHSKSTD